VQKVADSVFQREAEAIYAGYDIYHQSHGAEQAVFEQSSGAATSRSERLLAAFSAHVRLPERGRMLDIGCGNGAMLRVFSRFAPSWSLAGTELNEKYRPQVESIPRTEPLHTCPPAQVPGEFDLITMIHVLEHIIDPGEHLASLRPKLASQGLLLVELPHHLHNPFELLIADHCTHFTAASAGRLLRRTGYELIAVAEDWIPKELTIVARAESGGSSPVPACDVDVPGARRHVESGLTWLGRLIACARELSRQGPLGLFGTSIAATWLFSELQGEVAFFVDEDPNRIGRTCMDRPVFHPAQVPRGSQVLVGLPIELAEAICRRLRLAGVSYHLPPVD
jgi:SAM-dependent methyltransferase